MEILSIILCLWLFALVIALFIWMFVMQNSVTKLSDAVQDLKNLLLKDSLHAKPAATPQIQKPEIQSIDEIPNDILLNKKEISEETKPEIILPKPAPTQSKILENYAKQNSATEFEKIFLGNLFNKIGAFAILVGIILSLIHI